MTRSKQRLAGLLGAASCLAAAASQADVSSHAPHGPGAHPPGPPIWLCPLTASVKLTLNGACVAAPQSVAVAKSQPTGGGSPGAAGHQTANPSILVVGLGPAFSATLANWARTGGPPATIVITTYDGHLDVERVLTLKNAKPVSLTGGADAQLTLSYHN
jgi:hypothetical protein